MAVNVNETETKYDAPAGAALPRLDGLPQVAGTSRPAGEQLEAEYYDTGDLRLIRAGHHAAAAPRRGGRRMAPEAARRCRYPPRDPAAAWPRRAAGAR